MRTAFRVLTLAVGLAGCSAWRADETITKETEENIRRTDDSVRRTRTLSSLAKIEESLAAYTRAEHSIPPSLETLVPKFLAEIPVVEIPRHRDSTKVQIYPAEVLQDGQIDGSRLRDSGRWGYVHKGRQVVVFVDCTHPSGNGRPWFQERGAY